MGDIFELYAIKITERNGRAPLEGDVVTEAKDDYEQNGRPCVSMTMNSDGARRWAALTKKNVKRAIAIVLDGCCAGRRRGRRRYRSHQRHPRCA